VEARAFTLILATNRSDADKKILSARSRYAGTIACVTNRLSSRPRPALIVPMKEVKTNRVPDQSASTRKNIEDSALTANLPFAAKRLQGRSPTQNRASMIVTVCNSLQRSSEKGSPPCRKTHLKSIGLIFRQCCDWSVRNHRADTIRLRMIRCYGSLLLSTIWSIHSI